MGDTHWYKIKNTDNLITMKQWRSKCTNDFNAGPGLLLNKNRKANKNKKDKHYNELLNTEKCSKSSRSYELENIDELCM